MTIKICPKCHGYMFGPRYEPQRDVLKYSCGCGYVTTEPAYDKPKKYLNTEKLIELIKKQVEKNKCLSKKNIL